MQEYIKIDPSSFPLKRNDSWWITHPNSSGGVFTVPNGAVTVCLKEFYSFEAGVVYKFRESEEGWITVDNHKQSVDMPQYVFANHFDAEAFIRGIPPKSSSLKTQYEFKDELDEE